MEQYNIYINILKMQIKIKIFISLLGNLSLLKLLHIFKNLFHKKQLNQKTSKILRLKYNYIIVP